MTLSKKGSRHLVVNDVKYRFVGYLMNCDGETGGEVIIELFDAPREKIRARYSWEEIRRRYKAADKKIGKFGKFPPYVVRQTILYALANGWDPYRGGGLRDFGNLDSKIDFSDLQPEDGEHSV